MKKCQKEFSAFFKGMSILFFLILWENRRGDSIGRPTCRDENWPGLIPFLDSAHTHTRGGRAIRTKRPFGVVTPDCIRARTRIRQSNDR